ncbi:rhomboid family intramembrane serine protease [Campylobacter sp. US33a]|uniref:rhomboid family intramembrane serine protease n=1 Tax=Campylobacter sp. US33a TaxID=2498120 RepID=UPI001067B520|nr:rhomboid family intramembrane serine protease [Campylobacter sp. US33a]TEY01183.1 rhomboid family intramembrane serine protease [Campylobacter sp. US33a]
MAVIVLIAINILCFLLISSAYNAYFGLNLLMLEKAYYWQVLSSMFIHANFTHLILNMMVLYQFGSILERWLGAMKFFVLYFLGGLLCSLLSFVYIYFEFTMTQEVVNVVGASGAICVLMGYYAFLDKNSLKGLLIAILLISFLPLLMGVNIAWYGHIFGFVCGYILARTGFLQGR